MPVCGYCNSKMHWGEGIVLEGKWYEDKCYKQKLLKQKSELEKKYPILKDFKNTSALSVSGKMSVDEANEYQDIVIILTNLDHPEKLTTTYKGKPLQIKEGRGFSINKARFGKRTDTQSMIESGEISKVCELNPENGMPMFRLDEIDKPIMNAVFCPPHINILPYSETLRLEEAEAKKTLICKPKRAGEAVESYLNAKL